jgi:hypothetical protein
MLNPLNFEAGATPMPADPREIQAAIRAGDITHRTFPYYGFRYGERGVRFTRSDSAFLATLPGHKAETLWRQIDWLAGVLSNRGMPSWLLELHLGTLARQLSRAVPERSHLYRDLRGAAEALGERRRAQVSDETMRALGQSFAAEAGLAPTRLAIGTGHLLAAAVADERGGIPNAVNSIEEYFTDRTLFTARFIDAARSTIRRARAG